MNSLSLSQAEREEKREAAIARMTALKEMNTHLRHGRTGEFLSLM